VPFASVEAANTSNPIPAPIVQAFRSMKTLISMFPVCGVIGLASLVMTSAGCETRERVVVHSPPPRENVVVETPRPYVQEKVIVR
jgi:hypothetical protein